MHKRFVVLCLTILSILLLTPLSASALSPGVNDPNYQPDKTKRIVISSLFTMKSNSFVELHNQTDQPINLAGWSLRLDSQNEEAIVILPSGWLLGDSYVTLSELGVVGGVISYPALNLSPGEKIISVSLLAPDGSEENSVNGLPDDIATTKWYQRKSTGMSGVFVNDFSAATTNTRLRHSPLYIPPSAVPVVQIVEIYPRALDCAPNDLDPLCHDYVKLYNPTTSTLSLADYRLRTDSSTSESSNAFHLGGITMAPGSYRVVNLRDDGDPMSLTNSGGYVWLEDAEGVVRYEETITKYESAGSSSKQGSSWALNATGSWEWSTTPQPTGGNSFPVVAIVTPGMGAVLAECPSGKYRNPETNRCRSIEEAVNELAACDEGQYRNPETNRCRSLASTASAVLSACDTGETRNPETNRCRRVTAGEGVLVACDAGEERNPETNRCRKITSSPAKTTASVSSAATKAASNLQWWAAGVLGAGVVSYGLYEWRHEVRSGFGRLTARLGAKR